MKIAIVGNPNSGKTTIYNALTGKHERIGNYMGVTVIEKRALLKKKYHETSEKIWVIDLPGSYSLESFTEDEQVTTSEVLKDDIGLIMNVIDMTQLERALSFTLELIKLKKPLIIVLNKKDLALKKNILIDVKQLEHMLQTKVITSEAIHRHGLDEMMQFLKRSVGRGIYE